MTTPQSTQWRGIWLSFLTGLIAAIAITKASPALIAMKHELQLNVVQIGWIMSSVAIGTVLLGVYTGSLARQHGPKKVLQIALLIIIISATATMFAPSANWLITGRIIEGIAVILISVSAPVLIAHLSKPSDMGLTMGVWALWMPLGSVLVFLASPFILQYLDWRWLWGVTAILALPMLLLSTRIPELMIKITDPKSMPIRQSVIPGASILALIFICFTANFFSLITYLPSYLVEVKSSSLNDAILITSILPLFIIPGNLAGGFLIHRHITPPQIMIYPALILILIMVLLLNIQASSSISLGLLAMYAFFLGMIPTAIFAQAPRMASNPADIGRVIGIVVTGQGVGVLIGPTIAGYLIGESQQWSNFFPLLVFLPLLLVLLVFPLKKFQF